MGRNELRKWLLSKLASAENATSEVYRNNLRQFVPPDLRGTVENAPAMLAELLPFGPDVRDAADASSRIMRPDASVPERASAGLDLAGAMAMALIPGSASALKKGIRAYHGSPHDFDRFDMSKIGTGEGAQAYGHGLYFAESEEVAKHYRTVHAPRGEGYAPATYLNLADFDKDKAVQLYLEDMGLGSEALQQFQKNNMPGSWARIQDTIDSIRNFKSKMYEVEIGANPEEFLDWDLPLSEQPEVWKKIAQDWGGELRASEILGINPKTATGRDYLNAVVPRRPDTPKMAMVDQTEKLLESGIPGIKYLDAGSRDGRKGSRNYVVFDDRLITILRKYGIGGLIAGGTAYGLTEEEYNEIERLW